MNKVKVLHVIGTSPIGGIGTFLKMIDEHIDKSQFEMYYIYAHVNNSSSFRLDVEKNGSEVFILPQIRISNAWRYLKAIVKFYKEKSHDIDIIHVHSVNTGCLDLFLAKFYGIKIRIVHSHSTKYAEYYFRIIRNKILVKFSKILSTDNVSCSIEAGRFLFKNKDFVIINNSIDCDTFKYHKIEDIDINIKGKKVYGHIGNFTKVKNHSFLLDVFSEIYKINPNSILLLIGDGELRGEIKQKIKDLGISNSVFLLGKRDDVADLLSIIDVLIFPSLFEGFPLSLIEAQTAGVRCIVSSNITKETIVTDLVEQVSLDLGALNWAKIAERNDGESNRERYADIVIDKGFDVKQTAVDLEVYYKRLLKL